MKRLLSLSIVLAVILSSVFSVAASANSEDLRFSEEYKTSPYYTKLMQALDEHKITLKFDDGEVTKPFKITDVDNHPPKAVGDVDMDDEITILDVTLLQRYLANINELTPEQLMYADVDDNGEVEVLDATILQRYDVKLEDILILIPNKK